MSIRSSLFLKERCIESTALSSMPSLVMLLMLMLMLMLILMINKANFHQICAALKKRREDGANDPGRGIDSPNSNQIRKSLEIPSKLTYVVVEK